ncbi:MAG: sugar ABC transporter substrate-binding protein [Actinomycetaceae bacterium]|nr:sugar ABC transporter substrate-binding protein [Actinomycetaceae bacterium]
MLNRRNFLAVLAFGTTSAALAACSKDSGTSAGAGSAETLSPDTKAELTLAYWDKNQSPTIEANLASFKEKYPNITVTTNLSGYADYWKKLRTQAEGKNLPDVLWMNGPNIQLYAGNDMLEPLDVVTDMGIKWEDYPKALVDLYTFDGKHYGIPKDFDTVGVFYNKKIFADAGVEPPQSGWTWEDFHEKAKAISDWGKDKGIWGAACPVASNQSTYYNTIYQAGGYVIKDGKSGYDDPKTIEGLKCWVDWIADGSVAPPDVVADVKPNNMFTGEKSAMFWSGDWIAAEIAEAFKGREEDIEVIELPKKEKQATIIHGLGWAVSQHSTNKAAAKALAAHMACKESQEVEAANGTAIPAFNGTQDPWLATYPKWNCKVFIDGADQYAVPYPVSKNTEAWASTEGDYVIPAFSGTKPVEEAAKELAAAMNEALAKEK